MEAGLTEWVWAVREFLFRCIYGVYQQKAVMQKRISCKMPRFKATPVPSRRGPAAAAICLCCGPTTCYHSQSCRAYMTLCTVRHGLLRLSMQLGHRVSESAFARVANRAGP